MRWTLALLVVLVLGQAPRHPKPWLSQDDERLDFSDSSDRVESDEEVVEGTISLNGTVTPDSSGRFTARRVSRSLGAKAN